MHKPVIAALILSVAALPAISGEEGVLVQKVASIADSEGVLNTVMQALAGRGWTVKGRDQKSVTAELRGIEMKISIAGESLVYWDSAEPGSTPVGPMAVRQSSGKNTQAARWRANLAKDLNVLLAKLPYQSAPTGAAALPTQATDVAQRLKSLEALKSTGAITEAEYSKKRAEILDSL